MNKQNVFEGRREIVPFFCGPGIVFKGTVSRDFLRLVFFMNQFPLPPQSIPFRPFQICSKIRGDIRESRCTTGINDTGGEIATGINDTGGKFATGISDTSSKFLHHFR
jgi:hypothetical protein